MINCKKLIQPLLLLSLFCVTTGVLAETLSIINQPGNDADGVLRPQRGMQMQQVEASYGNPLNIRAAVGEPPITGWVYEKYTVYFEHEYVIHAAVHH